MRYPAAEKLEIIRLVEQSHLPVRRVLEQIGIPRSTFYRWCDLYQTGGPEGWTIAALGLIGCGTASPMTSARGSSHWPSTNLSSHPVNWPCALPMPSATSCRKPRVYRLLKAHDLITSPAFIVMKAADEFKDK